MSEIGNGAVPLMPAEQVDLAELDAFLTSVRAPKGCMPLSALDGFLTAIAIGPELVMPSEWLPVFWGDDEPEFADLDEARRLLAAVMGRYNAILSLIRDDPDAYEPILEETDDGVLVAANWAHGFMEGIDLRADAWQPLLGDDDDGLLLTSVLAQLDLPAGMPSLIEDADSRDELRAEASEYLSASMIGIDAFWQARRRRPRRVEKIGRNEPCPCGSGKKYKRCCGR